MNTMDSKTIHTLIRFSLKTDAITLFADRCDFTCFVAEPENVNEREGAGSTANICKISAGDFTSQAGETNNIYRFYNSGNLYTYSSFNMPNSEY